VLEPGGALSVRIGVRVRTKARVQPAKEGVLDSECEGVARRKLRRRRCNRVSVPGATRDGQSRISQMRSQDQFLHMLCGVLGRWSDSQVLPVELAAWTGCAHPKRVTSLRRRVTAIGQGC
jgi:hypothetical protein